MLQTPAAMLYAATKKLLLHIGITGQLFLLMIKGALPPTIAIAMYRSPQVARVYGNFGFLIALASILSLHLQPTARFLENIALATLLTCMAAAVAILSHFAGLKARKHTQGLDEGFGSYNSSASVLNAIFLCFVLWFVSALRAAWPQFTIPLLICTIYSVVAITNGPEVRSEYNSFILCKQLLLCYVTGFGISTMVSFLVQPKTSRSLFIESSHRFVMQCQDLLQKERDLLKSRDSGMESRDGSKKIQANQEVVVKASVISMLSSMSKLREELSYAKQEIAFGVYTYEDLDSLLHRLESLMIPLLGLSSISNFSIVSCCFSERKSAFTQLMSTIMDFTENTIAQLDHVLQHTRLLTRANSFYPRVVIIPTGPSQYKNGDELKSLAVELARNDFSSIMSDRVGGDNSKDVSNALDPELLIEAEEYLYILSLLQSESTAAQELLKFAKSLLVQGETRRWHIILPRITDISFFAMILNSSQKYSVNNMNPEHLPARNTFEKFGNLLRGSLSALGSDSSKFGFRIVAATMSIGIMAFLESTQHFFVEYRLVWAVVMTPISMSPTAGTAIYGFIGRGLGVASAMLFAYINWYIVDGKPAGVVVFFFLFMMVYYFLLLKYPRFLVLFILAAANHVLIIGYELQTSVKVSTAIISPQRYFPVYTLAPYRLLCVLAGLFVAFVFTVFPVQISEHKIFRKNVGTSLALLARYSVSVSATLDQRIRGLEGDINQTSSPGRILKARRIDILFKELALLAEMRQISIMVPWEVSLGGKFPKSSYDTVVDEIQSAITSLSVIAYISQTFSAFGQLPSNEFIREAFSTSLLHPASDEIATTISLLALSLSVGSQLAPGIRLPSARNQHRLLQRGVERLGVTALGDPNFEGLVAIEVAGAQLVRSMSAMVSTIRELVGTMNFGKETCTTDVQDGSMEVV